VSLTLDPHTSPQRLSTPIRPLNAPPRLKNAEAAPNSPGLRRLKQAAGEFEGILLSNLWKSMKSAFASSDDDSDDPAHETLDDMGVQAMSNAVGKAGGLGLGKLIVNHLAPLIVHSQNGNGAAAEVKLSGEGPIKEGKAVEQDQAN
jgi:Rod binding domain-containing protein